jgi:DNA modification methylase
MNLLINANAKRIPIADNSVNCVVTSPPYYGIIAL